MQVRHLRAALHDVCQKVALRVLYPAGNSALRQALVGLLSLYHGFRTFHSTDLLVCCGNSSPLLAIPESVGWTCIMALSAAEPIDKQGCLGRADS